MRVLIVGGVAGGMSAAARLRRLDESADIVVFERDDYVSFANCGMPYFLSGDIAEREQLLLQSPRTLRESLDLDVRTGHEVVAIDRATHTLTVRDRRTGAETVETYDALVLATGAAPVRPPLPGIDDPRVRSLRSITDMDAIAALVDEGVTRAVVIGGGYVGLEMVEALRSRDIAVTVVEAQDQVIPPLDPEMASYLVEELERNDVRVLLGTQAKGFRDTADGLVVDVADETIPADLVVLAVGVRPESILAREAGLDMAPNGAVLTDDHMRTSDPAVYAVGDSVQVTDTVTGRPTVIPLAGPANRQGRVAADNIAGRASTYDSTQGTGIVKVFDLTAAMTGANERALTNAGIPFAKVDLHPYSHASYYPGAHTMHLKVLYSPDDGRILGAQAVGVEGVDKRIDVLAVAIRGGMTVEDLESVELAYAPPYGSAKDAINMVGFVASNVRRGDMSLWFAEEWPDALPAGTVLLDVRNPEENAEWAIPGSVLIPLRELRDRMDELPIDAPIRVYCRSGFRSYLAQRVLAQNGWPDVRTLSGGEISFRAMHPDVRPQQTVSA